MYTQAIDVAPKNYPGNSVFFSNRAACYLSLSKWDLVISESTMAIRLQNNYSKPYRRRAQAYEETLQFEESLNDIKKLLELDPNLKDELNPKLKKLEKEVEEKRKKEQEQMIGQLKDMGNKFLGLFGLSTDNFKAEKDASGSYKINFSQ